MISVKDIVLEFLDDGGYDGLADNNGECACDKSDLAPCGNLLETCLVGRKAPCHCGDHDYHIDPVMRRANPPKEKAYLIEVRYGKGKWRTMVCENMKSRSHIRSRIRLLKKLNADGTAQYRPIRFVRDEGWRP